MTTLHTARSPVAGGRAVTTRILGNETGKGLHVMWRRRGLLASAILLGAVEYLLFRFLVGGGEITRAMVMPTLPALFAYTVARYAAIQGSGGVAEEVNGGTLEQTQLSPGRPSLLLLGRLGALAVEGLIGAVVLAVAFGLAFRVDYVWSPAVVVPVVLTILDALAYALLITALTLRVASIGAITHVFNMVIMFFGGLLIPVDVFPYGVEIFTRFVPTTLGVEVLDTTLTGGGLGAAWSDRTLPWLLVQTVVSAGLGWIAYLHTLRRARLEGGLGPR